MWLEELNPLFRICLNELNPFVDWLRELNPVFFFSIWLKDLTPLKNMIFKNWTFWKFDSKDWTFESVTQSTEPFFSIWVNESNPLFQYDSKNWFFFWIWRKELIFFEYWLKELNFFECDAKNWPFFFDMTQRLILFLLNFDKKINELNLLFKSDSKNWIWLKGLNFFSMWLKEFNFWTLLQIWLTLRVQPIWTFSYDSTNWTYFTWLKELNLIELSFKELNLLFHDSKNWTFFLKRLNELNFFCVPKNCTYFVECDPKNWTFFVECDPKNWIIVEKHEELILFTKMTENWTLFELSHMTRRNEHFLKWLKELNLFECGSKNWTFFFLKHDSKNWTLFTKGLQELIFSHFFQRFEPFLTWLTELNPFWTIWLIEIEPFFSTWVKENDSFLFDSKIFFFFAKCMTQRMNWSFLENMTLRISIFERKTYSKNWTFSKIDSMDWTFCFTWPKELNLFFLYNSKDWTFSSFLNPFSTIALNDWPCFEHDSQNWTFLFKMTQRIEHMTWLKVLIELF